MLHIADIQRRNIDHIAQYGITKRDSPNCNKDYVSIGDPAVIKTREDRCLIGNKSIKHYIPFYFGPRSIMLYVIQKGYNNITQYPPQDIVYCVVKLSTIIDTNVACVFTDGHALNRFTKQYPQIALKKIDQIINYEDVYASTWIDESDMDKKRRKEAELLIDQDLPVEYIAGYVVYNQEAKDMLIAKGIDALKIVVKPSFYF